MFFRLVDSNEFKDMGMPENLPDVSLLLEFLNAWREGTMVKS